MGRERGRQIEKDRNNRKGRSGERERKTAGVEKGKEGRQREERNNRCVRATVTIREKERKGRNGKEMGKRKTHVQKETLFEKERKGRREGEKIEGRYVLLVVPVYFLCVFFIDMLDSLFYKRGKK